MFQPIQLVYKFRSFYFDIEDIKVIEVIYRSGNNDWAVILRLGPRDIYESEFPTREEAEERAMVWARTKHGGAIANIARYDRRTEEADSTDN